MEPQSWIQRAADGAGIALGEDSLKRLLLFLRALKEGTEEANLTGFRDDEALLRDGVGQALSLFPLVKGGAALADIGSGAGFPGLVWACLEPERPFVLIESRQKKSAFLSRTAEMLGVNVVVREARAEDLGRKELRESLEVAVARAVGSVSYVAELALPLLAVGGRGIFPKGPTQRAEVEAAKGLLGALGGSPKVLPEPSVAGERREGFVLVVEKVGPTPAIYPRKSVRLGAPPEIRRG